VGDAALGGAHIGITDEEADRAAVLALERRRIKAGGSPPHSVSLIWGCCNT